MGAAGVCEGGEGVMAEMEAEEEVRAIEGEEKDEEAGEEAQEGNSSSSSSSIVLGVVGTGSVRAAVSARPREVRKSIEYE